MSSDGRGPEPATAPAVERRTARYLLAIATLSESGADRVTTGALRERLEVTAASVTEMLSKLAERGLIDYEKYHGATLTDRGRAIAVDAGWRFCVVATFFESVLDTELDDRTAFGIGHALPRDAVFELRDRTDAACLGLCPGTTPNAA